MSSRLRNGYNDAITNTFDMMRISTRQKLVGSAAVLGNVITNDYDLNEIVSGLRLEKICKMFQSKFEKMHANPTVWIVDFKSGEYNHEPIRWDMKDMRRGYKVFGSSHVKLVDCLVQENTKTKLDVVLLINNRFIEISELYYMRIGGKSNFTENDFDTSKILNDLHDDMKELIDEKNYFKALKREYRILSIMNKRDKRLHVLDDLFNGKYGYLYYAISQLKTLIIMKQQTFRSVDKSTFLRVQQNIKDDISRILNYPYAISCLNDTCTVDSIERIITYLNNYLNYRIQKIYQHIL